MDHVMGLKLRLGHVTGVECGRCGRARGCALSLSAVGEPELWLSLRERTEDDEGASGVCGPGSGGVAMPGRVERREGR